MAKIDKYKKISTVSSIDTKKPVIGIDRDGVINKDIGTYITVPQDFEPITGSLEAIAELRKLGHQIVIITNQGGIEKGIMTEADVDRVHEHMLDLLCKAGCPSIDGIYYSSSSNKKDPFAKPNIGMFKQAEKNDPNIKFKNGIYIGDKMTDLKAAIKIGAKPILVRTGYGIQTEQDLKKFTYKSINFKTSVFDSLADFASSLK